MTPLEAIAGVTRLFVDSAPVIYFVEGHPQFFEPALELFRAIDAGLVSAVTSPITLAECLVVPVRHGSAELQFRYTRQIVHGRNTEFVFIDEAIAATAATLRVRYGLALLDSLQVAVAVRSGCDALLTNDRQLKRVIGLTIILIDDLER